MNINRRIAWFRTDLAGAPSVKQRRWHVLPRSDAVAKSLLARFSGGNVGLSRISAISLLGLCSRAQLSVCVWVIIELGSTGKRDTRNKPGLWGTRKLLRWVEEPFVQPQPWAAGLFFLTKNRLGDCYRRNASERMTRFGRVLLKGNYEQWRAARGRRKKLLLVWYPYFIV